MTKQAAADAKPDQTAILRLAVLDAEDLAVVSAHLQDAETSIADMIYLRLEKRFALVVSRFDWPLAAKGTFVRRRTGLHFERVMQAARSGFPSDPAVAAGRLLAITFVASDPPGGHVLLTFSGGAQIRLSVECLEAELRDLGPWWDVGGKPASSL